VDENQLRELIRLLKAERLTEITICEGDERITVRQALPGSSDAPASERPAPAAHAATDGTFTLDAPLVGTFYTRPSPEDDPFVSPGDVVQPDDVVGIIEAMKVMNEVKAEQAGRVRRLLVEDGAPVEYGQELVVFEPL
jgi:acetyl-CoA carboxylase biotin carboxyl carrier protein